MQGNPDSGILCFGIRTSTAQGIRNLTDDWDPSSTDKYWNSVPRIRNTQRGIQDRPVFPYME